MFDSLEQKSRRLDFEFFDRLPLLLNLSESHSCHYGPNCGRLCYRFGRGAATPSESRRTEILMAIRLHKLIILHRRTECWPRRNK